MFLNKKYTNKAAFIYREGIVGNFDSRNVEKNSFSFCFGAREALWSLVHMNYELILVIDEDRFDYDTNARFISDLDKNIKNDLLIHGIKINNIYFSSDLSQEVIKEKNIDISNSIVIADRIENLEICRMYKKLNGYLIHQKRCFDKGNVHYKAGGLFELIDAISIEEKNNRWRKKW